MTFQNYTCPRCKMVYGKVASVSELDPMTKVTDPCLVSWCQKTGYVYEFYPEARE